MPAGHIHGGFGAVRPYLYGHGDTAVLLRMVFDAEEMERHQTPKGAHIEARIGDSVVVLELLDPPVSLGTAGSVYVYVPDVDEALRRARAAGFDVFADAADKPYRERAGGLKDAYGNIWWVSTYVG